MSTSYPWFIWLPDSYPQLLLFRLQTGFKLRLAISPNSWRSCTQKVLSNPPAFERVQLITNPAESWSFPNFSLAPSPTSPVLVANGHQDQRRRPFNATQIYFFRMLPPDTYGHNMINKRFHGNRPGNTANFGNLHRWLRIWLCWKV